MIVTTTCYLEKDLRRVGISITHLKPYNWGTCSVCGFYRSTEELEMDTRAMREDEHYSLSRWMDEEMRLVGGPDEERGMAVSLEFGKGGWRDCVCKLCKTAGLALVAWVLLCFYSSRGNAG